MRCPNHPPPQQRDRVRVPITTWSSGTAHIAARPNPEATLNFGLPILEARPDLRCCSNGIGQSHIIIIIIIVIRINARPLMQAALTRAQHAFENSALPHVCRSTFPMARMKIINKKPSCVLNRLVTWRSFSQYPRTTQAKKLLICCKQLRPSRVTHVSTSGCWWFCCCPWSVLFVDFWNFRPERYKTNTNLPCGVEHANATQI